MRYKNVIQKEKRKRRDIKMEEKLNNNAKTEKQKRKYRPRNNKVNKTNNEGEKTKKTTKKSKKFFYQTAKQNQNIQNYYIIEEVNFRMTLIVY